MAKGIAMLCIIALMFLSGLGNFWFTYGIWPKSWVSFTTFSVVAMLLHMLLEVIKKED
jgi:hypothetical protein